MQKCNALNDRDIPPSHQKRVSEWREGVLEVDEELTKAKSREPEELTAENAVAEMKEGGAQGETLTDLLGRALGPIDRGRSINLVDACKTLWTMVQGNIVVWEVLGDAASLRDRGEDEGLAEQGDTRGSEDQGGAGGVEG